MFGKPFQTQFSKPLNPAQFVPGNSGGSSEPLKYLGASAPVAMIGGGAKSTPLTIVEADNRVLIVFCSQLTPAALTPPPKFNGVSLTLIDSFNPGSFEVAAFYLLESDFPSLAGTYNITFTPPGSDRGGMWGVYFKNAKQEAPAKATFEGLVSVSSWSNSITTTADDSIITDISINHDFAPAPTVSGQVEVVQLLDNSYYFNGSVRSGLGAAGSKSLGWSVSPSASDSGYGQMIVAIKPF